MTDTVIRKADPIAILDAHATVVVLREAIRERWRFRAWYRSTPYTLDWPTRQENDVQLRELVRVARRARDISRPVAVAHPPGSPWTESELREAYGR